VPWPLRLAIFVAYVLLLAWLTLAPASLVEAYYPKIILADKLVHFLCYGMLVLLARLAFRNPRRVQVAAWLVPVLALIYGFGLEVAQGLLVQYHRSFEWADMLANGLGAVVFWLASGRLLASSAVAGDKPSAGQQSDS